tara:strand:+ start:16246 stop:16710 length:465 start_codon:yes stop_codon:yes gene_type:complete
MAENNLLPLIQEKIKSSMKEGDKLSTSTLRIAISEFKKEEIDKKIVLDDDIAIGILQRMIKQRKESASQFKKAGREDLELKEESEIEILATFLPDQLSEIELKQIVADQIQVLEAGSIKDLGKLMSSLSEQLKGKADMSLVAKLAKETILKEIN